MMRLDLDRLVVRFDKMLIGCWLDFDGIVVGFDRLFIRCWLDFDKILVGFWQDWGRI